MSVENHNNSDDDLTTDAIPSAPRDEIKKDSKNFGNTQPKLNTKTKTYKKGKKASPTAFASVINISNANGIHVGSNYNVYLNNKSENASEKQYIITDAIKLLFNSQEAVQRKHLIFLATHINEDWRNVGRLLDYSDGQISQFYENYIRTGIKEVIYQLLLDWIQNEADAASVARLAKTLWDSNQKDAVNRWAEEFGK